MPRPGSGIADPRLTQATGRFTSLATFERRVEDSDSVGEPVDRFATVTSDVACHPPVFNAPKAADGSRGGEVRSSEDDVVEARRTVLCQGTPDARADDECHVDGARLGRVRHTEHDHRGATTRVLVEAIE